MYECATCGYQTKRKWSFDYHNSRKTPCKPKAILHIDSKDSGYSALKNESNKCYKCSKIYSRKSGLTQHLKRCNGVKTIHCPICLKVFASAQTKCEHKKNVKCQPPVELETLKLEIERLKQESKQKDDEIVALKSGRPITINNTTNNNSNNTTNNNSKNNSNNTTNIQMNNYDKPYTDHIINEVMKRIFETSQKDPALIINETVRCIYKNDKHPENHVIKIGEKTLGISAQTG